MERIRNGEYKVGKVFNGEKIVAEKNKMCKRLSFTENEKGSEKKYVITES